MQKKDSGQQGGVYLALTIQVEWARSMFEKNPTQIKPILTNGPILALMKEWQARLYLDQRGQLVDKFRIKRVPAVVSRDGMRLKVVEHNLSTQK